MKEFPRNRPVTWLVLAAALACGSDSSTAATNLAPTNTPPPIAAPVVDPDHVVLRWAAGTNEASFRVYLGTASLEQRAYITGQELTLNDLDPDTYYQWRVDAYDENRRLVGTRGTVWFFKTGSADPRKTHTPTPSNRSTVTNNQSTILLWNAGSSGGSFNIYFGKDSTPDETEFRGNLTGNPAELSYFPGILEPNKQYYWRIDTVVDVNGAVVPGRTWTFQTDYTATNYPTTNTILYADDFENGSPNSPPVGWACKDSQPRLVQVEGRIGKSAMLTGDTWIERIVPTRHMKDIRVSYSRSLTNYAAGESFSCEWSTNGAVWHKAMSESAGDFSDATAIVALGAEANDQPAFRLRFSSSASGTTNRGLLDNLRVLGVYAPKTPTRDTQHDIRNATFLLLGDSLTSNNGALRDDPVKEHWTDQLAQRFSLRVLTAHAYDINDNSLESRLLTHGKGGSRAYFGQGAVLPTYHGDDAPDPNLGGYQRLRWAFQEINQGLYGMVRPDFVIINFGMNDHKRVWKDGESTGQSSPSAFNEHFRLLVDFVRTNGSVPILVTPHDFFQGSTDDLESYYSSYSPELFNNAEDNYSALGRFHNFLDEMRKVARGAEAEGRPPVDLIDLNEASTGYDAEEFTVTGGVHLDKLGHDVYAQVIGDFLSARFGDGSLTPPPPPPATNCPAPSQPPPAPITGNFVLVQNGCWTTDNNWNNDQPPSETNLVYIRSGLTAVISYDVGMIRRFYLGDNASTYPPGTGTLNISAGGKLVTSLDGPEIGRQKTPGAVGNLNISGGVLQIGVASNYVLKVGVDSAGTPVTGNVTISGGDFRGGFLIGSTGVAGATPDLLRIVGDAGTVGSVATSTGLELCESGILEYVFGAAGISDMRFAGAGVFHPSSMIIVDGADYEGGAAGFELLRCTSFTGTPNILLKNFPAGTSYNWSPAQGSFSVAVGEQERPVLQWTWNNGILELNWPEAFPGWYVQSNSVGVSATNNWFDVPGSQSGNSLDITVSPSSNPVFYRLRSPQM